MALDRRLALALLALTLAGPQEARGEQELRFKPPPSQRPVRLFTEDELARYDGRKVGQSFRKGCPLGVAGTGLLGSKARVEALSRGRGRRPFLGKRGSRSDLFRESRCALWTPFATTGLGAVLRLLNPALELSAGTDRSYSAEGEVGSSQGCHLFELGEIC